jgi:hypothetical protein
MAAPDEETPFVGPPADKNYPGKGKIALLVALGLVGAALGYTTAHVGTSTATHLNSVGGPYDGCYMDKPWTCPADRECSTPDEAPQFAAWPGCFECCFDNERAWNYLTDGSTFATMFCKEDCQAAYNKCQGVCNKNCDGYVPCDCGDDVRTTWC